MAGKIAAKAGGVEPDIDDTEILEMDSRIVMGGVSLSWIGQVFRMDRITVKKRLAGCEAVRNIRGNTPLFDLKRALPYLIPPVARDLHDYIMKMTKEDLPMHMRDEFWSAKLKEQKWQEQAGELWRTEDVQEVFMETFKLLRETIRMIPDTIEFTNGLTPEHRKTFEISLDSMQTEMRRLLMENAKIKSHGNLLSFAEQDKIEKRDSSDAI